MSANRAIHVSGFGDFLIEKITRADLDSQTRLETEANGATRMDKSAASESTVLATPEPGAQDSLERENAPNPLDAEQTWPTEEVLTYSQTMFLCPPHVMVCSSQFSQCDHDSYAISSCNLPFQALLPGLQLNI